MLLSSASNLSNSLKIILNNFQNICNCLIKIDINNLNNYENLKKNLIFLSNDLPHALKNLKQEITSLQNPEYNDQQRNQFITELTIKLSDLEIDSESFKEFKNHILSYLAYATDEPLQKILKISVFLEDYLNLMRQEGAMAYNLAKIDEIKKKQEELIVLAKTLYNNDDEQSVIDRLSRQLFGKEYSQLDPNATINFQDKTYSKLKQFIESKKDEINTFLTLPDETQIVLKENDEEFVRLMAIKNICQTEIDNLNKFILDHRNRIQRMNLIVSKSAISSPRAEELKKNILMLQEEITQAISEINAREKSIVDIEEEQEILQMKMAKLRVKGILIEYLKIFAKVLQQDQLEDEKIINVIENVNVLNKFNNFVIELREPYENMMSICSDIVDIAKFYSLKDRDQNALTIEEIINSGVCGSVTVNDRKNLLNFDQLRGRILKQGIEGFIANMFTETMYPQVNPEISETLTVAIIENTMNRETESLSNDFTQLETNLSLASSETEIDALIDTFYLRQKMHDPAVIANVIGEGVTFNARRAISQQEFIEIIGDLREESKDKLSDLKHLSELIVGFLVAVTEEEVKDNDNLLQMQEKLTTLSNDLSHQLGGGGSLDSPGRQSFF